MTTCRTGPRVPRLTRIPEICIEILPTSWTHERIAKRLVYAAGCVEELWVIDGGRIERFTGARLHCVEVITGVLRSPLLDGFELDVPSLFVES